MKRHATKHWLYIDESSFLVCDEIRKKLHSFKLKFSSNLVNPASLMPQFYIAFTNKYVKL